MRNPPIDFDGLISITDHLKALVAAEDSITEIERRLKTATDNDAAWRHRAKYALESWKSTRRRITARLALLRQQEKEATQQSRETHCEYLIEEMKRYFPRAAFLACDHRARLRMQSMTLGVRSER